MTAPRIDRLTRTIDATLRLLELARDELHDLHALAYDRHAAAGARAERVSGSGRTDWALDTHGDPKARTAYETLARQLDTIAKDVAHATTDALHALHTVAPLTHRRDTTADAPALEIAAAIAAQHRRRTRGEYTPHATAHQPPPRGAGQLLDAVALREELDALRNAIRKQRIRPDRSRLTPRELTAWDTALNGTPRRRKPHPR